MVKGSPPVVVDVVVGMGDRIRKDRGARLGDFQGLVLGLLWLPLRWDRVERVGDAGADKSGVGGGGALILLEGGAVVADGGVAAFGVGGLGRGVPALALSGLVWLALIMAGL